MGHAAAHTPHEPNTAHTARFGPAELSGAVPSQVKSVKVGASRLATAANQVVNGAPCVEN